MLLFGLRLALKIFNAVADALQWILQQQGVEDLDHYLQAHTQTLRKGGSY